MVQGQQDKGLHKLGLDGRGADRQNGLAGEDRGALGHGPDVAGKLKVQQILQKLLAEAALAAEIFHVLLVKGQVLDILHHLGQARGDGKTALVGHRAVEHVEIADPVLQSRLKIAVGHGQLIKITQHRQVCFRFHS